MEPERVMSVSCNQYASTMIFCSDARSDWAKRDFLVMVRYLCNSIPDDYSMGLALVCLFAL